MYVYILLYSDIVVNKMENEINQLARVNLLQRYVVFFFTNNLFFYSYLRNYIPLRSSCVGGITRRIVDSSKIQTAKQ